MTIVMVCLIAGPALADQALIGQAQQGDAQAQYKLGLAYHRGEGVPQDDAKAIYWWNLSARQGNVYAQHDLGLMYYKGQGVKKSLVRAHMWMHLAAYYGSSHAGRQVNKLERYMARLEILRAELMALRCIDSRYKNC